MIMMISILNGKKYAIKQLYEVNGMEKFSRTMRGYDPEEVNNFLDKVINQVETMVN